MKLLCRPISASDQIPDRFQTFCSKCRACVVFFNRHLEEHYKQSVLVVQLLHVEESYLINELITQRIVNTINILIIWKHFGNKLAGNLTLNELAQPLQVQNYSCSRLVNFGCEFGYIRGFWYFAEKKEKFRGIFRGKFAEKSADFAGFSQEDSQNSLKNRPISVFFLPEKSQNSQKNRPISRNFSGKKSNYEGFSGANSKKNRPISREISGGDFAKKQSVKNSRFRRIFGGQI